MREQSNQSLGPSRDGALYVSAWTVDLCVRSGHLEITARTGRDVLEERFARIGRPKLRRLVLSTKGGYTSWEAFSWCRGAGVGVLVLDRSGRVLVASGEPGSGVPALRRAQIAAADNEAGLQVVKYLLGLKLAGQRTNLERFTPSADQAIEGVASAAARLECSDGIRDALASEAKAAGEYWGTLARLPVNFARADVSRVPARWLTIADRHSPLSASPRRAVSPINAITNFLYQLGEYEASNALLALGLDPHLGWAHLDNPYRASAALDVLEAIRPDVDRYVLALVESRAFGRREFIEQPNGETRLGPILAKELAESTLALWERAVAPVAEEVARILSESAASPVRIRTRLSQSNRRRGRTNTERASGEVIRQACRSCGVILEDRDRMYCDDCLPEYHSERTAKLSAAGTRALARMRASDQDPAQTEAAKARLAASSKERMLAIRAWERINGKIHDWDRYESEMLPLMLSMTVPELVRVTGLSQLYCWQVRAGKKRLHPMHWKQIISFAQERGR